MNIINIYVLFSDTFVIAIWAIKGFETFVNRMYVSICKSLQTKDSWNFKCHRKITFEVSRIFCDLSSNVLFVISAMFHSVWIAILIHFVQYYFFTSRHVSSRFHSYISLYYARESVVAKITFEVSQIFCRAGFGQNPTRNLARGPWLLSGPTRPGPHYWRPVVARGNIFLARMAQI